MSNTVDNARNPLKHGGFNGFHRAERVGFEPTVPLRGHLLSREAQSAVLCHLSRCSDSVAAWLGGSAGLLIGYVRRCIRLNTLPFEISKIFVVGGRVASWLWRPHR